MSFVSEDVATVSYSADCSMQAAYDRELGELYRLPVVTALGKKCKQILGGGDSWKIYCYEGEQGDGMFCDFMGGK
jgi:hypothetical protein